MLLNLRRFLVLLALAVGISSTLTACASAAPSGDYISDYDVLACEEFQNVTNPFDGSNESLWDSDSMQAYEDEIQNVAQYAEESDLIYYFDALASAIEDVLAGQTDGSDKSDVESWMDDVASAEDEVSTQCDLILNP